MENDGSIKQEAPSLPLRIFEIPGEPAVVINGVPDEPQTDCVIAKDEPISSSTVGSGEWLEGRQVRKFFCGQYYSGKVTKFDKESGWYRVVYEDGDSEDLDWSELEEKLCYLHDIVSGDKPTAVAVARGTKTNSSATFFGVVAVADDPLTVGPEITSGEVGRAQGVYATADQKKSGLLMTFNLVFTTGEFSGSTVVMYGRNPIWSKVREMPIIGGTGAFRFGSGYALAKTFRSILWLSIMSMFGISF